MDRESIMVIEYMDSYGSCDFEMVAVYNNNVISESEVRNVIKSGAENDAVIIISKVRYENVFGALG